MKIKTDSHGVYIRTDGGVYRPYPSRSSYTHLNATENGSSFKRGDEVKARHVSQTPFAKVERDGVIEWWHFHGCYFDGGGRHIASDKLWDPKESRIAPTTKWPTLSAYRKIKALHPNVMVFYRIGDFFEIFDKDAEVASKVCELSLSWLDRESEVPIPMFGVPVSLMWQYIRMLNEAGHTVLLYSKEKEKS